MARFEIETWPMTLPGALKQQEKLERSFGVYVVFVQPGSKNTTYTVRTSG